MDKRDDEKDKADGSGSEQPDYLASDYRDAVIEMKGALRMALEIVSQPVAPMTPEEEVRAQSLKGLVELGREIARGEDGNPIVRENADLIAQRHADRLMTTVPREQDGDAAEPRKSFPRQFERQRDPVSAPSVPDAGKSHSQGGGDMETTSVSDHASTVVPETDNPALKPETDPLDEDRRLVPRPASRLPRFSEVAEAYFASWAVQAGKNSKDIRTARRRAALFAELIGDHPVDTYKAQDLQAYVRLLQFWPGDNNKRPEGRSAYEIIEDNRDLHLKPISLSSLKNGYLWIARTVVSYGASLHDFRDPFDKVRLHYPRTAARPKSSQPLSAAAISSIFRTGVESGLLDEAMLPLLGHLTGRRLGLLIHLTGNDIREKYPGVWVAETDGIVKQDGIWKRVPIKTDASTSFFVLHGFLEEIGFIKWARAQGDRFLFAQIMKLKDPSKSASSYMQRLFLRAGIEKGRREVFHSLRAGNIEDMRDAKVDPRDRRMQAGHTIGTDEHDNYGFKAITEIRAREMVRLPLNPEIDYSVFCGLDFEKMARKTRAKGKRRG